MSAPGDPFDPVIRRRRQITRLAASGRRLGYSLYLVSLAVFIVGLAIGFNDLLASITAVCLVVGSVVLAPAIIVGYGVRAANRADREDDW